jgi:hypothetical protein
MSRPAQSALKHDSDHQSQNRLRDTGRQAQSACNRKCKFGPDKQLPSTFLGKTVAQLTR